MENIWKKKAVHKMKNKNENVVTYNGLNLLNFRLSKGSFTRISLKNIGLTYIMFYTLTTFKLENCINVRTMKMGFGGELILHVCTIRYVKFQLYKSLFRSRSNAEQNTEQKNDYRAVKRFFQFFQLGII